MRKAIFPGSFNPFTIGHLDIVERGLTLFDEVVIAVGKNYDKQFSSSKDERASMLIDLFRREPRVSVEWMDGLTIDFAHRHDAQFILRSVRSLKDYEYERDMAEANRLLSAREYGKPVETVLLFARPDLAYISSSLVRELKGYGRNVDDLLPHCHN